MTDDTTALATLLGRIEICVGRLKRVKKAALRGEPEAGSADAIEASHLVSEIVEGLGAVADEAMEKARSEDAKEFGDQLPGVGSVTVTLKKHDGSPDKTATLKAKNGARP